jgi:nucleotidyltransferase/DNA polymerase involved in DNA repair
MVPQRCPGAVVLPFDAPYYQQRYEELLVALDEISPAIEAQPPEVFYLDLTGLPYLDGEDPEGVLESVRVVIPALYSPRLGIASGKFAAWVAAHCATPARPVLVRDEEKAQFLQEVPSTLLPVSDEVARQLDRMGLRTLGRIARLPRSAMLSRFGWTGERLHRLVCGEDREPLTPYRPVPVIRETWPFSDPPTSAHFSLALEHLLQRAWSRPERGDRGVRQVRLQALLEAGDGWEQRVTLHQPTERPEHAAAELRRRLEAHLRDEEQHETREIGAAGAPARFLALRGRTGNARPPGPDPAPRALKGHRFSPPHLPCARPCRDGYLQARPAQGAVFPFPLARPTVEGSSVP